MKIYLEDKFFKSQGLWVGAYKNRIEQPKQSFSIKYLELILVTP